jgi:hypothetical protein
MGCPNGVVDGIPNLGKAFGIKLFPKSDLSCSNQALKANDRPSLEVYWGISEAIRPNGKPQRFAGYSNLHRNKALTYCMICYEIHTSRR